MNTRKTTTEDLGNWTLGPDALPKNLLVKLDALVEAFELLGLVVAVEVLGLVAAGSSAAIGLPFTMSSIRSPANNSSAGVEVLGLVAAGDETPPDMAGGWDRESVLAWLIEEEFEARIDLDK